MVLYEYKLKYTVSNHNYTAIIAAESSSKSIGFLEKKLISDEKSKWRKLFMDKETSDWTKEEQTTFINKKVLKLLINLEINKTEELGYSENKEGVIKYNLK